MQPSRPVSGDDSDIIPHPPLLPPMVAFAGLPSESSGRSPISRITAPSIRKRFYHSTSVAWQLEIPVNSNNVTENLKKRRTTS